MSKKCRPWSITAISSHMLQMAWCVSFIKRTMDNDWKHSLLTTREVRGRNSAGMISLIQGTILIIWAQSDLVTITITTTISNNLLPIHRKLPMKLQVGKRVTLWITTKILIQISNSINNNLTQRVRVIFLTPKETVHSPNSCRPIRIRTKPVWVTFKSRIY